MTNMQLLLGVVIILLIYILFIKEKKSTISKKLIIKTTEKSEKDIHSVLEMVDKENPSTVKSDASGDSITRDNTNSAVVLPNLTPSVMSLVDNNKNEINDATNIAITNTIVQTSAPKSAIYDSVVDTYIPENAILNQVSVPITIHTNTKEIPTGESININNNSQTASTDVYVRPESSIYTPSSTNLQYNSSLNDAVSQIYGNESSTTTDEIMDLALMRHMIKSGFMPNTINQSLYVGNFTRGLEQSMNLPKVESHLLPYLKPKYIGCYNDSLDKPVFSKFLGITTPQNCSKIAKKKGHNVFGIQFGEGIGYGEGECRAGDEFKYKKYGIASDCILSGDNYLGGYQSNAVYKI